MTGFYGEWIFTKARMASRTLRYACDDPGFRTPLSGREHCRLQQIVLRGRQEGTLIALQPESLTLAQGCAQIGKGVGSLPQLSLIHSKAVAVFQKHLIGRLNGASLICAE